MDQYLSSGHKTLVVIVVLVATVVVMMSRLGTQQLDITRSKEMTVLGYDKHISSLIKRYGPDGCLFLNLLSTGKGT